MHFLAKKFQKKERKIKFSNTEALGVCAQVEGAVLHHVAAEVTGVHRVLVHQAPVGLAVGGALVVVVLVLFDNQSCHNN